MSVFDRYTEPLHHRIKQLEAENTLMNELVSDLKRKLEEAKTYQAQSDGRLHRAIKDRETTIEHLRDEVNRLSRALIDRGVSVTQVRNIASG